MNNKEKLTQLRNDISQDLSDLAKDFINETDLENVKYICGCFNAFADLNTSIYYTDQRNYYYEHTEDCDNAFLECFDGEAILQEIKRYGVDSLICKAGAWGEYNNIICELYQQEKEIKKVLFIDYLLKKDNLENYNFEKLEEIINDALIDNVEELDEALR